MSYKLRIASLEEAYRQIDSQISYAEKNEPEDIKKLVDLRERKMRFLDDIRKLRRMEYEDRQRVDFDDDR